jgi:hypothetical protein
MHGSCAWSPSAVLWYHPGYDACVGHAHAGVLSALLLVSLELVHDGMKSCMQYIASHH